MAKYSAKQCALMVLNPYVAGMMVQAYPFLQELIQEGCQIQDTDRYFRYLALAYDPYSPMVRELPDVRKRKTWAAREMGLTEPHDNLLAISFVKQVIKSRLWTLIVSVENTYDEFTDKVNKPILGVTDEDLLKAVERKGKMLDSMGKMLIDLKNYYRQLYDGDKDLEEADKTLVIKPETMGKLAK